jgi:hypothetical protein
MDSISCTKKETTIALDASLSPAVGLGELNPVAIDASAAWTAAVMTFQGSIDGGTYFDIYDAYGNEYSVVITAGKKINIDYRMFLACNYIKLRSGTTASAVTQEALRTLGVCLRKVN